MNRIARLLSFVLVLLAFVLAPAAQAQADSAQVKTEQVTARLVAWAPEGVPTGTRAEAPDAPAVWVGLELTHIPHWHTYWKNSGDSGLPTELTWTLPPGVMADPVSWPVPKKIPVGGLANYGYEGKVLLPVRLHVSAQYRPPLMADAMDVKLHAMWLVCKLECIPQEGDFALKLPFKSSTALHAGDFEQALAAQPADVPGTQQAALDADGQRMHLRVTGLPEALHGQVLELFPETPSILAASARLGAHADANTWTQRWDGATWVADVPVARDRSASPAELPIVLTANDRGYRVEARVDGTWPAAAVTADVSPTLAAALQANADSAAAGDVAPVAPAPQRVPAATFWLALLGALVGGMILNLMPCVFPILAIKVLGFTRQGGDGRAHRIDGLAYSAGVVLSFVALGGLMLALRAAGAGLGWGFQLQSPVVVAVLAALFTVIGLNLAGVFEFGRMVPSRLGTLQARNPVVNSGLSGVLAVAVASPCTAPFMGAALGLAIALPAVQALAIFAALGIGMALPYLAASWIPALARALPKPGAWMDVFKKFMAFPMFGTAVWLLWVLGQQSGIDGAAALLALLVVLAFALWAFGLHGRARHVTGALAVLLALVSAPYLAPHVVAPAPALMAAQADTSGRWQTWSPQRVDGLLAEGRPVFVDFTAAWCVTCQVNKKTTLGRADVLAALDAKNVQTLRADWTRRDPAISAELKKLGRSGVPVYLLQAPGRAPVVLKEILSPGEVKDAIATL